MVDKDRTILANVNSVPVRYLSSPVCLFVVCLSVTLVRPTQRIEIFSNVLCHLVP